MRASIPLAAALLASSLSSTLAAQDPRTDIGNPVNPAAPALKYDEEFSRLDRDDDYVLQRSETAGREDLASQFDTVDANKDGTVSQAEFSVFEADTRGNAAGSSYNSTEVPVRDR